MKPIISIIVPIFNAEKDIERCIQSILNQTFNNFELILINDGSTDCSLCICEKFSKLDQRVKVITQINKGVSASRNSGLKIAKGDYILFVDSDDYIVENMIEILYALILEKKVKISICNFYKQNKEGLCIPYSTESISNKVITNKEAIQNLYSEQNMLYIVMWNKLFHHSIFEGIKFKEGVIFEDEQIIHYLYDKVNEVAITSIPLYFYQYNEQSITNSPFSLKKLDVIEVFEDRLNYLKDRKIYPAVYNAEILLANSIFSMCKKLQMLDGDYTEIYMNLQLKLRKQFKNLFLNPYYSVKSKIWMIFFSFFPNIYLNYILKKNK